jgi:hypothetical protein
MLIFQQIIALIKIGLFYGIVLLTKSDLNPYFLSFLAQHRYSAGWELRLIFYLFLSPIILPKKNVYYVFSFYLLLFLPFSIITAWMENISLTFWLTSEAFLVLLMGEILWLFSFKNYSKLWIIYCPLTLFITTAPVFFFYIYWEIWKYSLYWVLWISPCGLISQSSIKSILPHFSFLLYPLILKIILKIFGDNK